MQNSWLFVKKEYLGSLDGQQSKHQQFSWTRGKSWGKGSVQRAPGWHTDEGKGSVQGPLVRGKGRCKGPLVRGKGRCKGPWLAHW